MAALVYRLTLDAWRSPAFMTWASFGVRVLGFALVLPLLLSRLPAEEVAVWFVFQSLIALQGLADFGFTPTFVRAVAYANAGGDRPGGGSQKLAAVVSTMRYAYFRIALAGFSIAAVAGSLAVAGPIAQVNEPASAWAAWLAMLASGSLGLWSAMFGAFLQGAERIALLRRWEAAVGCTSALAAVAALVFGAGLPGLAFASLAGVAAGSCVNRALAVRVAPPDAWSRPAAPDAETMRFVWPAAWRSGLGVALSFGAIRGSSVIYAQLVPAAEAAAYLLAQRVMQALSDFANVPFYTRLPTLARLYAENRRGDVVRDAAAGMWRANALLVAGIVVIGLAGTPLLALLGSRTSFVDAPVWWLLGGAILVERIGAMHLQLYSTTNRIVWHIANGGAGLLMLLSMPLAYAWLGLLGLPLGILIGYGGFYAPYSMLCSYRAFGLKPAQMDLAATAAPLAVVAIGFMLALAA